MKTMRYDDPIRSRRDFFAWLRAYAWYLVNLVVAFMIASVVAIAINPAFGAEGTIAGFVAFGLLMAFFFLVWPPIPRFELWLRSLWRREAGHTDLPGHVIDGRNRRHDEQAGQVSLHVPKREVPHRRPRK